MSLCPEADFRASLSDGEFWDYVLNGIRPGEEPEPADGDDEWSPIEPEPEPYADVMCPECGGYGACGYDAEGRPMIHVRAEEDA